MALVPLHITWNQYFSLIKLSFDCKWVYTCFPPPRERYDGMVKELEQKQEAEAERLSKLQQEYQQSLAKAGVVR